MSQWLRIFIQVRKVPFCSVNNPDILVQIKKNIGLKLIMMMM